MDIVELFASQLNGYVENGKTSEPQKYIDAVIDISWKLSSTKDKIRLFRRFLDENEQEFQDHLKVCTKGDSCQTNRGYTLINYMLGKELQELGVKLDENTFSLDEEIEADSKIDELINEVRKNARETSAAFEILFNEIQEMKELKHIGKKNWYQLLAAKGCEMIAGGLVSETVVKEIVGFGQNVAKYYLK